MGTGQAPVEPYRRRLRDLRASGRAGRFLLPRHVGPGEAPEAHRRSDAARDQERKAVLLAP